jgi:O-antigen/teichoic acid export membrane protein
MVMLLVPAGLFVALSQIWQSLAACDGKFKDLSGLRITQALSVTLLQVAAGLIEPTAAQLALSHSLGALLAVLWALRYVPMGKKYFPTSFSDAVRSVREVSSRYRRFPIYALPADAINTAAGQLPLILLQSRFGSDVAGWTALALRIFGAPIALLGGAVRDVFKNSSSKAFISRGECETEYWHTFKALAVCSAVGVPLFMIISEPLFSFGYGENWRMAGTICVWLTPMFAMRFISSPLSYTLYLAQKQKYDLAWQTSLLVFTWSAFTLPASYKSALLIYSMGYGLLYGVYCVMSHRFSKGKKTL